MTNTSCKIKGGDVKFGKSVVLSDEDDNNGVANLETQKKMLQKEIDDEVAALMRRHNDANVIAFGQKFMKFEDVIRRVEIFINTPFEGGRHAVRVGMIKDIENK